MVNIYAVAPNKHTAESNLNKFQYSIKEQIVLRPKNKHKDINGRVWNLAYAHLINNWVQRSVMVDFTILF